MSLIHTSKNYLASFDRRIFLLLVLILCIEFTFAIFLDPTTEWEPREEQDREKHSILISNDVIEFFTEDKGDSSYVWLPVFQIFLAALGKIFWVITLGQSPDYVLLGRITNSLLTIFVCVYTFILLQEIFGNQSELSLIAIGLPLLSGYYFISGSLAHPTMLLVFFTISGVYHTYMRYLKQSTHEIHFIGIISIFLALLCGYEAWPVMLALVSYLIYHEKYQISGTRTRELFIILIGAMGVIGLWMGYSFIMSGHPFGWRQWQFEKGYAHDIQILPAFPLIYKQMIKGIGLTALALFIYPVVSLLKNRNQFIFREYDSKQNFTVLISFVFVTFLSYILLSTMSGIWFLPRNFLIFLPFSVIFSIQLTKENNIYLKALGIMILASTIPTTISTLIYVYT
ncbi:MAG: hypothetical protein ACFFDT_16105 [Candidatus Hodarchaeota archaeon]